MVSSFAESQAGLGERREGDEERNTASDNLWADSPSHKAETDNGFKFSCALCQ